MIQPRPAFCGDNTSLILSYSLSALLALSLDELRLKLRIAVTWDINLNLVAPAASHFLRLAITRVVGVLLCRCVLLIAQMMSHLAS